MKYVYKIGAVVIFFILLVTVIPLGFSNIDLKKDDIENNKLYMSTYEVENHEFFYRTDQFKIYQNFSYGFWYINTYNIFEYNVKFPLIRFENDDDESYIEVLFQHIDDPFSDNSKILIRDDENSQVAELSENDIFSNVYHHLFFTHRDKNMTIFLDGERILENYTIDENKPSFNSKMMFGETSLSVNVISYAYFSELYFFNRTLSKTEINSNMGNKYNSTYLNYTAYYSLYHNHLSDTEPYYIFEDENNNILNNLTSSSNDYYDYIIVESYTITTQYNLMKNVIFIVLILLSIGIIYKIGIGEII